MTKTKVSATVSPERLARAKQVSDTTSVSELLEKALEALIERELEHQWLRAHPDAELPGEVVPDLSALPWEDA
ncbi:MAG: ribbon-helix-helix domain-containing protein [Actinomycetota bacterium]|nr:ribbon-helix-helix domain-containing protein [Actinomycetota bacterium]MDQ3350468.1 ribbon-helix-helix domain-containing protein [Actinomycetota bacterium]